MKRIVYRKILGVIFCSGFLVFYGSAAFGIAEEVGFVEEVQHQSNAVAITRNGVVINAVLFLPIFVGDRIEITGAAEHVVIRMGGGKKVVVRRTNSPYHVKDNSEKLSVSANVREWLSSIFGKLHKEDGVYAVPMNVRSGQQHYAEPPNIALLELRETTDFSSGDADTYLEWIKGVPPFELQVVAVLDGQVMIRKPGIETRTELKCTNLDKDPPQAVAHQMFHTQVRTANLPLGQYQIFIADSLGNVASRRINIVEEEALGNVWRSAIRGQEAPKSLLPVLRLGSLMTQSEAGLLFAARQALQRRSQWSYPMRLLGNRLMCNAFSKGG